MNINRAKAVSGFKGSVAGPAGLAAFSKHCKAAVILARKKGDDTRAAELSEAWQTVKDRLRRRGNYCEECGARINRLATRCHLCQRKKASLPPGECRPVTKQPRESRRARRCPVAPQGGLMAELGLYTPALQKVFARWQKLVPSEQLEAYLYAVASTVIHRETRLDLPAYVAPNHWQAIFEIGNAISALMADRGNAASWLLRDLGTVSMNGQFPSWDTLSAKIVAQGGPRFTAAALANCAKRMRLLTPESMAKIYRESV